MKNKRKKNWSAVLLNFHNITVHVMEYEKK